MGASLIGTMIAGPLRLDTGLIQTIASEASERERETVQRLIDTDKFGELEDRYTNSGMDIDLLIDDPTGQNTFHSGCVINTKLLSERIDHVTREFAAIWNREWGDEKDDIPRDVAFREFRLVGREPLLVAFAGETSWGDSHGYAGGIFNEAELYGILEGFGCH